jgi:hypothetical protein
MCALGTEGHPPAWKPARPEAATFIALRISSFGCGDDLKEKHCMAVDRAEELSHDYGTNTWLIQRLTGDISHPESLAQPSFPANCMNWVLGHIIYRRNTALDLLGDPGVWEDGLEDLYRSGSEPIEPASPCRAFGDLQEDLEETKRRLEAALGQISDAALDAIGKTDRGEKPVAEHLQGLHWHETFHLGQLDVLRSLINAQRDASG